MLDDIQIDLVRHIRDAADWRRMRSQEFDADPRNLRSAAGLDRLADYVLNLPEDDPRLRLLGDLTTPHGFFEPGQRMHFAIARFHYFQSETTFDGFLDYLVDCARADRGEAGRLAGRLPEGEDDPFLTRRR